MHMHKQMYKLCNRTWKRIS